MSVAIASLERGQILVGRYVLERLLGEGGMGTVWCARQLTTDRPVALKFLKGDDPGDRARFLREAKVAAGLAHRNIVQVFDFWEMEEGGPIFLVMELLEGQSLAELLEQRGALSLAEMAAYLVPVAQALSAAHAEGIVHRDLKPENIFLAHARDGAIEVKVVDFGLARRVTAPADATAVTQTGAVMGTPQYMAPEQVYGESDVDARADVWALGVLLHQCATGRRLFDGENFGQVFRAITLGYVSSVLPVRPDLPPTFDQVVQRMLAHDRNARPRMDEVARVIASGFSPLAFAPTMPAHVSDPPPPLLRVSQPPPPLPASTMGDLSISNPRVRSAPASRVLGTKAMWITLVAIGFVAAFSAGMSLTRTAGGPSVIAAPPPATLPAAATVVPVAPTAAPVSLLDAQAAVTANALDAAAPATSVPPVVGIRRRKPQPDDPNALLNRGRF